MQWVNDQSQIIIINSFNLKLVNAVKGLRLYSDFSIVHIFEYLDWWPLISMLDKDL